MPLIYVQKSAWKVLESWHTGLLSIFKEDGERPLPYSADGHLLSDPCTPPCLCLMLQSWGYQWGVELLSFWGEKNLQLPTGNDLLIFASSGLSLVLGTGLG